MLYITCSLLDEAVIEGATSSLQRVDAWKKSIINTEQIASKSFDGFNQKITEIHNGLFSCGLPFMMVMGCSCDIKPYPNSEWISGRLKLNPCFLIIFKFNFVSGSSDKDELDKGFLIMDDADEDIRWFTFNWSIRLNPGKPSMIRLGSQERESDFLTAHFKQYSTEFESAFSQHIKAYIPDWNQLINGQFPVRVLSPRQEAWASGFMQMTCQVEMHLHYNFIESPQDLKQVFAAKSEVSPLDEIRQMLDESSKA